MNQLIRTSKGHIQSQHITHTKVGTRTYDDDQPSKTYIDVYLTSSEDYLRFWDDEAQQLIKWLDNQSCPVYLLDESEKT